MQSTQAELALSLSKGVPVPPLRSQNRPRIGRGYRDVARVCGAPRHRSGNRHTAPSHFTGKWAASMLARRSSAVTMSAFKRTASAT